MSELLASFAAAGGAPPASHEVVRVSRDGTVRALGGTPWPGLGPVNEAGAYAFALDAAALGELERLAEAAVSERLDGPLEPGSGRYALQLREAEALRWDPFTTPPAPVAALADRLRELLVEARAHPLAAVRIDLDVAGGELTYRATALGDEPLLVTLSAPRARVVEAQEPPTEPPPLAWVRESVPVEAVPAGPARLAPGETLALAATLGAPPAGARHRIDGFVRVALDLAAAGEAKIEATLAAGPVSGRTGS